MANSYLDREFIRWFYEEPYPALNSNRAKVFSANLHKNVDERDYWMRCAFKQGAKAIIVETSAVLGNWAAAVEGLDPELVTPSEVFDRAQENLNLHYQQLELFK